MLSYIKGIYVTSGPNEIVVDNNGIGYSVQTSQNSIDSMPEIGTECQVFTKLIPREDAITLYGFSSKEELAMFELLLSVSGIGPKGALAILSVNTVSDIQIAVASGDAKAFSSAPGVGKKTAERALIDLKDKVDYIGAYEAKLAAPKSAPVSSVKEEVLQALVALGYSQTNAKKALDKMTITESVTVEQLLSDTLKQMSFL